MPLISAFLFIVAGLNLFLATFTLLRGPKKPLNISFFLLGIAVTIWTISHGIAISVKTDAQALLWTRVIMVGPILLPVVFGLFARLLPGKPYRMGRALPALHALFILLFFSFLPTKAMITDARVVNWGIQWGGGWAFNLYSIYYLVFMGDGLRVIFGKFASSRSVARLQLLYVAIGASVSIGFGLLASLILPIVGMTHLNKFGPAGTLVMVASFAYAIVRYRLLDVNLVFRYATTYTLFALSLTVPFSLIALLTMSKVAVVLSVFAALLLSPVIEKRVIGSFQRFVDTLPPFKGKYKSLADIPGFQRVISSSASVAHWAENVVQSICKLLEVDGAAVFVLDEGRKMYLPKAARGLESAMLLYSAPKADDPLVQQLRRTRKIVQLEYIAHEMSADEAPKATQSMQLIRATLCAPFFDGDHLIGFVGLGRKVRRGGAYFEAKDIDSQALMDTLDIPVRNDPNVRKLNSILLSLLGLKSGEEALKMSAEQLVQALNLLVDLPDLAAQLPRPESIFLMSEASALLSAHMGTTEDGEGKPEPLTKNDLAILNSALVASVYAPELPHFNQEESFNPEDLKAVWGLVRGAEGALMVILVTLASQMQTFEWAHDLRHPFTKGSFRVLDALLDGRMGPLTPGQWQALSAMRQDANFVERQMAILVNPEIGRVRRRAVPLKELLDPVESRFRYMAQLLEVTFNVAKDDSGLRVLCDPELVNYRVINNLMDNALRHTPKGGSVEVGFNVNGKEVVCHVKNVGGDPIPEAMRPHLFERGVHGTKESMGLGGLGLFNVAKVIESHDGKVWVESSKQGGTSFFFTLPIAPRVFNP